MNLATVIQEMTKAGVEEKKAKQVLEKYIGSNNLETKRLMRKLRKQANREKQQALAASKQDQPKAQINVLQNESDPKFLVAGNFLIPVTVDEELKDNHFYLMPSLTQEDVSLWIQNNPEKARKLLIDAQAAMDKVLNQHVSISYVCDKVETRKSAITFAEFLKAHSGDIPEFGGGWPIPSWVTERGFGDPQVKEYLIAQGIIKTDE